MELNVLLKNNFRIYYGKSLQKSYFHMGPDLFIHDFPLGKQIRFN